MYFPEIFFRKTIGLEQNVPDLRILLLLVNVTKVLFFCFQVKLEPTGDLHFRIDLKTSNGKFYSSL